MHKFFLILVLSCFAQSMKAQNNNSPITMGKFVGINVDAKANYRRVAKFESVREFHIWSQDIGFSNSSTATCPGLPAAGQGFRWVPSYEGAGFVNFDQFYPTTRGISPALMGIDPQMTGATEFQLAGHERNAELKALCWNSPSGLNITDFPNSFLGKIADVQPNPNDPGVLYPPSLNGYTPEIPNDYYCPNPTGEFFNGYPLYGAIAPNGWNSTTNQPTQCIKVAYDPSVYSTNYYSPSTTTIQALPSAYSKYALWATTFAARYGKLCYPAFQTNYENVLGDYVFQGPVEGTDLTQNFELGKFRVQYFEIQNETDKTWRDPEDQVWDPLNEKDLDGGNTFYQYKPNQYAALLSAAYDGHGQSPSLALLDVGNTGSSINLGIKTLNSSNKVVMGGIADFHGAYIEKMMLWCQQHRQMEAGTGNDTDYGFNFSFVPDPIVGTGIVNNVLPFDVINFHHYSCGQQAGMTNGEFKSKLYSHYGKQFISGRGIYPEKDFLRDRLVSTLQDLRDANGTDDGGFDVPGLFTSATLTQIKSKEVWLTEFGYDTGNDIGAVNNNFLEIPTKFENTATTTLTRTQRLQTQANWLVRSYLELSAVKVGDGQNQDILVQRVRKAFAFTMKDKLGPEEGNENYDHSGLLFNDNSPKPSWYDVLTLQYVLRDYVFDADLSSSSSLATVSGTNVPPNYRLYRYKHKANTPGTLNQVDNLNRFIYVAWTPTFTNEVYNKQKLTIKGVEGNLPPGGQMRATLIEPTALDENGKRTALSVVSVASSGSNVQEIMFSNPNHITGIQLSERPIYIYTCYKQSLVLNDGQPMGNISGLDATKVCCGSMLLNWTVAPPVINTGTSQVISSYKYHVYFIKKSEALSLTSTADLLAKATLASDEISGATSDPTAVIRYTVSHKDLNADNIYRFYVMPIRYINGNPVLPTWSNIIYRDAQPGSDPTQSVLASQISHTSTWSNADAVANAVFVQNGGTCLTTTDPNVAAPELKEAFNTGKVIEISLNAPGIDKGKRVYAIYLIDGSGNGLMQIDYQRCNDQPDAWLPLLTEPVSLNEYNKWKYLSNLATDPNISKLRFKMLNGDCGVKKVQICTGPEVTCPAAGLECNPNQITHVEVSKIDESSAQLEWPIVSQDQDLPEGPMANAYKLVISDQFDLTTGRPVGGIDFPILDFEHYSTVIHQLENLLPATHYYGEIQVADLVWNGTLFEPGSPCGISTLFDFITEGTIIEEQALMAKETSKMIEVYPNPARDFIMIDFNDNQFERIVLMNGLGYVLYDKSVSAEAVKESIEIKDLPEGWYVLRAIRPNGTYQSKVVLVSR
jgi:Secretion system C-terminal sorting domain